MKKSILLLAVVALLGSCKKEEIRAQYDSQLIDKHDVPGRLRDEDPHSVFLKWRINSDVNHIDSRQNGEDYFMTGGKSAHNPMSVYVTGSNLTKVLSFSITIYNPFTVQSHTDIAFGRSFGIVNDYKNNSLLWEYEPLDNNSVKITPVAYNDKAKKLGNPVIIPTARLHNGFYYGRKYRFEIYTYSLFNNYFARYLIYEAVAFLNSKESLKYDFSIPITNYNSFKNNYASWYVLPTCPIQNTQHSPFFINDGFLEFQF